MTKKCTVYTAYGICDKDVPDGKYFCPEHTGMQVGTELVFVENEFFFSLFPYPDEEPEPAPLQTQSTPLKAAKPAEGMKKSNRNIIVAAVSIFVVFCMVVCSIGWALFGPDSAAPVATAEIVPSRMPSNTPLPTETRTPTATIEPTETNTPLPTFTLTPPPTFTLTFTPTATFTPEPTGPILGLGPEWVQEEGSLKEGYNYVVAYMNIDGVTNLYDLIQVSFLLDVNAESNLSLGVGWDGVDHSERRAYRLADGTRPTYLKTAACQLAVAVLYEGALAPLTDDATVVQLGLGTGAWEDASPYSFSNCTEVEQFLPVSIPTWTPETTPAP